MVQFFQRIQGPKPSVIKLKVIAYVIAPELVVKRDGTIATRRSLLIEVFEGQIEAPEGLIKSVMISPEIDIQIGGRTATKRGVVSQSSEMAHRPEQLGAEFGLVTHVEPSVPKSPSSNKVESRPDEVLAGHNVPFESPAGGRRTPQAPKPVDKMLLNNLEESAALPLVVIQHILNGLVKTSRLKMEVSKKVVDYLRPKANSATNVQLMDVRDAFEVLL
ncbi:unnamed protein product [Soboliphyme baturini]|uniref:Vesicle-fusing ATPase n=1 Tax=Soboliphyme baturini TaxID=241478 RepID=A0A183I9X4_9BILA|nr:unnamed protein product [Soboliphyme baturini]